MKCLICGKGNKTPIKYGKSFIHFDCIQDPGKLKVGDKIVLEIVNISEPDNINMNITPFPLRFLLGSNLLLINAKYKYQNDAIVILKNNPLNMSEESRKIYEIQRKEK